MADGRITFDTIQGAEASVGATYSTAIRTGTLEGIDATALSDPGVIFAVLSHPEMPPLGQSVYPGTALVFTRLIIRGYNTNAIQFAMYHETQTGIIPSAYIITDDSSMSSRTATFDPFTKKLLEVSYSGTDTLGLPGGGSVSDLSQPYSIGTLDRILCPTDALMPMREINVLRISVGHPNVSARSYFGSVNDATWPGSPGSPKPIALPGSPVPAGTPLPGQQLWTTPAPVGDPYSRGYWIMNKIKTTYTYYQNYFQTEISALSMVNIPWWQLLVARDPATGLYVKPRPAILTQAITDNINNYQYGLQQFNQDGFGIWGPYPTADFTLAFGF